MPVRARDAVEIPEISVPTYVFGSPDQSLSDSPIIVNPEFPSKYLTLATYRHWSQRLACGLRNAGFRKGDRLLFVAGNSIAYPTVFMGTLMAGGILTGASPTLDVDQLGRMAADLAPTLILATQAVYATSLQVAQRLQLPQNQVYLFEPEYIHDQDWQPENGWQKLLASESESATFDWTFQATPSDTAVINFTSGSTGHSKGVIVSHRNLVANATQYVERQRKDPASPENGNQVNWVMWTPMYHVIGQNQYCIIAPRRGICNYIMDRFDLELLFRYTERYRPSEMLLMPPLIIAMLSHPLTRKYDLSSVTVVHSGGSPLRDSVIERFLKVMPNPAVKIRQGWGMTEITCVVTDGSSTSNNCHSVGQLLPNCEAKIMTPDGQTELGPDEPGELWIRSPNVAQGYLKRPELNAATFFAGGWLRTGDFGTFDSDGHLYVRDRIQDIIHAIDGAYALPTDLESIILGIPGIKDAGVVSVEQDCPSPCKVPRAFVVLDHQIEKNVEAIRSRFDLEVRPHEQLKGGIYEISEIPRLPSGKVHRNALKGIKVE